jgi:hypothetical protein
MSDSIKITLTGKEAMVARFNKANTSLLGLLRTRLSSWAMEIRDLMANAAGRRTGKLSSSITANVSSTPSSVRVDFKADTPYAAIQEFGGTIPGHEITPIKGQALAFAWGMRGSLGSDYFAHVFWPGATIPGKHYVYNTLRAHRAEFLAICQQAAADSMKQ